MIHNWDIISRIDPQTKSLLYSLVTDGNEQDARLISKKLAGYAQPPAEAVPPFVYQFELPADMDEELLSKIRTAVAEVVAQTKKVNQFAPGGSLGNPLFHTETKDLNSLSANGPQAGSAEKPSAPLPPPVSGERMSIDLDAATHLHLQPAEEVGKPVVPPPPAQAPQPPQPQILPEDMEQTKTQEEQFPTSPDSAEPWPDEPAPQTVQPAAPQPPLEEHTAPAPAQPQEEPTQTGNPINDKDMLIKDMEGTLLDQMPLEDIFDAKTKYDMFLDINNEQAGQNARQAREQKMDNLADGKASLEETFNVFEQKIKDETAFMDLEDIDAFEKMVRQQKQAATSAAASPADKEAISEAQVVPPAPRQASAAPAEPEAAPQPATTNQAADTFKLNLEDTETQTPAQPKELPDEQENTMQSLPEEVEILNTQPPLAGVSVRHFNTSEHPRPPQNTDGPDLPEITVRENIDALDKTFNLETTMNTEMLRRTFKQTLSGGQTEPESTAKPASHPEADEASADGQTKGQQPVQPTPEIPSVPPLQNPAAGAPQIPVPPRQTFRIRLKTQTNGNVVPKNLQNDKKAEPNMEENHEEKTTFRIRRKITAPQPQAPQTPATPAPSAPAQPKPHIPLHPASPAPAQAVPPTQHPQAKPAQPAPKPGMSLGPNSSGAHIEKTKTIDHSIELPLSELKKHNWPLEVPLVPTFTLENMVISVNRFAHATAISVIDSPGKLYNPLVLYGPTGTGKTHFLNAIGYAMSQKMGQENIFMTNGVRLSRGIQRYVMEGNIEKFEKFMDSVQVLLIDDIHLVAVNEQNRAYISKLLNKFLREQKQIVITSKYPPESLAKLEELINFRLDSGWISELKTAHGPAHIRIVKKMLADNGVDLTDNQVEAFFGAPNMTLSTVARSIRRIKVLEKVIFPGLPDVDRSQAMILEKLLATKGEDKTSMVWKRDIDEITTLPPFGKGEWGRIGFFYPHNNSDMMNWMVYALSERAKELGIEGSFEIAVRSSYATENIISSAFKIANLCDNKKLKGAVILGPSLQICEPSVRENFYDILTHMLEVMLIRCGIINMEDVKLPSTYVKIISELLR